MKFFFIFLHLKGDLISLQSVMCEEQKIKDWMEVLSHLKQSAKYEASFSINMVINHKLVHQNRSINLTKKVLTKHLWQCKKLMENLWIKFEKDSENKKIIIIIIKKIRKSRQIVIHKIKVNYKHQKAQELYTHNDEWFVDRLCMITLLE